MTTDPDPAPDSEVAGLVVFHWQKATTALEAVERSLYSLADIITGTIVDRGSTWEVATYPRAPGLHRVELEHRVRQEVIDQGLRLKIAERTDPVRNLVFALAFSKSGLTQQPPSDGHETS